MQVSRPPVREAMISMEVQGVVEVRFGYGAYVRRFPGKEDITWFNITALEWTKARMIFEAEATALAANQISDQDLVEIANLVEAIAQKSFASDGAERAASEF